MKKQHILIVIALFLVVAGVIGYRALRSQPKTGTLTVGISPYQDIAMITNIHSMGLEEKYGMKVNLVTMPWENIPPAVASAGDTVDIGFGSLVEYLTKEKNLNASDDDPVLFIYPAYIFKGGGFVTFRTEIPVMTQEAVTDRAQASLFLSKRIGAQKDSIYEKMIYSLARRNDIDPKTLKISDTPLNDGILAAQAGSLDIAEAGLTQITEARSQGGRVVLTMEDLGFADITGFICKKSTLKRKRSEVEKLIRMWFETVDFVLSDIDRNSAVSLSYLDRNAATKYTLESYKSALAQEYFPRTNEEAVREIISETGRFSYRRISDDLIDYLKQVKGVSKPPTVPEFISLTP